MNTNSQETTKPEMTMMSPSPRKRRSRAPAGNPKSLRGSRGIAVVKEETETSYAILLNKKENCTFPEFERGPKSSDINIAKIRMKRQDWIGLARWLNKIRDRVLGGNNILELALFRKMDLVCDRILHDND
jgi:hypothetical protein